jgi:NADP-dependent 3-hydroxy acid dehydrogenase YdfG
MPTTLITGATGGIGMALARELEHHHLILLGRNAKQLKTLRQSLPNAMNLTLDLRQPQYFLEQLESIPHIDNLIHNAGIAGNLGRIENTSLGQWQEVLDVNLLAAVELTRICLPRLRNSFGQVLFVNSVSGLTAHANWSAYAASKFALRAFADALAEEEPTLRIQSIYPGRTATQMQEHVRAQENALYQPEKYIQPETLAKTIRHMLELPRDSVLKDVIVNRPA